MTDTKIRYIGVTVDEKGEIVSDQVPVLLSVVQSSGGGKSLNTVGEIFTSGADLSKSIEGIASGAAASRSWPAGNRPKKIIITAKPSDVTTTEIVRAAAMVNLVFDASTPAIGESLAAPVTQPHAGLLPYRQININEPTEIYFPKTLTYDGLSAISVYADGIPINVTITAVK